MNTSKSLATVALTVLFLAACSSGGIGDILGGGTASNQELRGTVDAVDTSSRSIYLTNVSGYQSMLSSGGSSSGGAVRVYYDTDTTVSFNGQSYRPEDLERGDEVAVRVQESGNTLTAESMTVLRDSSSGTNTGGSYPSTQISTVRGTVRSIDTARRTIEIESASWISGFNSGTGTTGTRYVIEYDTNARVDVSGALQPISGLERGDVIEVQVSNSSGSTLFAQRIFLVRDVRR